MKFYDCKLSGMTLCLCPVGGTLPEWALEVSEPFEPLVFLVDRDPLTHRGIVAVHSLSEVEEEEGISCLLPVSTGNDAIDTFLKEYGGTVVNNAFPHAMEQLLHVLKPKRTGLKLDLIGLGDVGGTLLTALKLLGADRIDEIGIYDFNEAQCKRYEMELNQVLERPTPRIVVRKFEDLFEGDALLFTASRGVPPVGAEGDMRMLQFEKNRDMLKSYTALARKKHYRGLFLQIADPVDLLARSVFLQSNRSEDGTFDFDGMLPEQVLGFGLGVMAARAAYMARRDGVDDSNIAAFGPHGNGLVIANDASQDGYDEALSEKLTAATVGANMEVRALGFKPYIAPALSSACLSILNLFAGKPFYCAAPLHGINFGSKNVLTDQGLCRVRQELCEPLQKRIQGTMKMLSEKEADCRR